jgi:hypothetical protein
MSDIQILIHEVARIALQDGVMTEHLARELDVHVEELQQLGAYLERAMNYAT